jgi:nucleoside-diphosphate-sugar epimerase
MKRAKKMIGFKSHFSLEEGLKITWDWFLKNKKQYLKRKSYF